MTSCCKHHADSPRPGQSHEDKLAAVRKELENKKHVATVVNALDDVAWLFNLRGSDIDYNPGLNLQRDRVSLTHFTLSLLRVCCCDYGFCRPLRERFPNRRLCAKAPWPLRRDPTLRIVLALPEGAKLRIGKGTQAREFEAPLPTDMADNYPSNKANLDQ